MILEITIETWKKCGVKTVKHYNEKEDIIGLWQKMSEILLMLSCCTYVLIAVHTNIADVVFGRIKKYYDKKQKTFQNKKNKNIKHILKVKKVFSLLKNLHVM